MDFVQKQNMYFIEEIQNKDLPLNNPLYKNYPAMKLGHTQQIDFYAELLCQGCLAVIAENPENNWVLTAPAYYHLPAAANLLARSIHGQLHNEGVEVELVEPRLQGRQKVIQNQQEFTSYHHYSKNDLAARTRERERVQNMLDHQALQPFFQHKSVLVINDINVTGTQQKFIQASLDEMQVKDSYWFYIFTIDKTLAANNPEIEYQLNHCQIDDLQSYSRILSDENTQHTARSIARLFNENMPEFTQLVNSLSTRVRKQIYLLARSEGRYGGDFFADKMQLLAGTAHR